MPSLPPVSELPHLDTEERAKILDTLFEPCVQLHTLAVTTLKEKSFSSYDEAIAAVGEQLNRLYQSGLESDTKWLQAILSAHPRLGEKKVESEQSRQEQAQLNRGGVEGEAEKLSELNQQYEQAFPGLRYVVFVNGRSRSVIMEDMQRRIERGNIEQEKIDAIKAMCDIASDRAAKLGA